MVHMYSWKVIIVSLFARIWLSICCYTLRTLSKFLETLHCLCNFLDIGGFYLFILVVFDFSCSGPSCSDTWEVTVLKRGKESLSILATIILLILNIEQTFIHSFLQRRRQWHTTPVFLPGKSHGRRSLEGCSPWGHWGLDTTERLHFHFSLSCIGEGHDNPLQCSCLENPRDGGAWWAAVYGVTQSRTRLKRLSSSISSNGNNHFGWCWFQIRHWGCLVTL